MTGEGEAQRDAACGGDFERPSEEPGSRGGSGENNKAGHFPPVHPLSRPDFEIPGTSSAILGEAACVDDFMEVFRARKDELKLSNAFIEECLGLTSSHADKLLGPSRRHRRLNAQFFAALCETLALKFVAVPDPEAAARMAPKWEKRVGAQLRLQARVSEALIARVAPIVLRRLADQIERDAKTVATVRCGTPRGGRERISIKTMRVKS